MTDKDYSGFNTTTPVSLKPFSLSDVMVLMGLAMAMGALLAVSAMIMAPGL